MTIHARVLPTFPGAIIGSNGIGARTAGGVVELMLEPEAFATAPNPPSPDATLLVIDDKTKDVQRTSANALLRPLIDETDVLKAEAEFARDQARDAASDAVSQSNVPIYASVQGMLGTSVPVGITALRVNGYALSGDGGEALYSRSTGEPVHEGKFRSADGAWWEVAPARSVDLAAFGAVYSNPAAAGGNAIALAAFLRFCALTLTKGTVAGGDLYLNPVDVAGIAGDLDIECFARVVNAQGTGAAQRLLLVDGGGVGTIKWRGGVFDEAGGTFTCLEVRNWESADIYLDEACGISCTPASANSASGLVFSNIRMGSAGWGYMHDMEQGSNAMGSVPRCFTAQVSDGQRSDVTANIGRCADVHGVIVVGDMGGGQVTTYDGVCHRVQDNGIYNVGDASSVECHNLFVDTIDEMFVNTGSGTLTAYGPIGRNLGNAIGLQNADAIEIFGGDLEFAPGATPFKTRGQPTPNVSSKWLEIRGSRIVCTPRDRVVDLGSFGTIEDFVDIGNTWIVQYDAAVANVSGGFWNIFGMPPGARCRVESDSAWIVRGPVPASAQINIALPAVTELSRWDGRLSNETRVSSSRIRLNGARQRLLAFRGTFSISNVQSDGEANYGALDDAPPRVVWGTAPRTVGFWPRGSVFNNASPAAGAPSAWVCIEAGSPGTWEAVGRVRLQGAVGYSAETIQPGQSGAIRPVAVAGVAPGDFVSMIAASVASVGEVWIGSVTAAGVVTVRPFNPTNAAITTTAGNVRVRVEKL